MLQYLYRVLVYFISLDFFLFFNFGSSLLFLYPEKFGYVINRLVSFIDPSKGDKFQSSSALDAIKLGGLKGQGMGEGVLKMIPEAHTDYIIAIISEVWFNNFNDNYFYIFIFLLELLKIVLTKTII